ncbi:hypothetical protein X551_03632 [Methylibium sp. T29]|nr:hypothetical protein X551_03632 [Methylibium sp. T29]
MALGRAEVEGRCTAQAAGFGGSARKRRISGHRIATTRSASAALRISGGTSRITRSAVTLSSRPASAARPSSSPHGARQLDADHQALAADLGDAVRPAQVGQFARQPGAQPFAHRRGVLEQAVLFHHGERLDTGAHRQRIAAEGGAVVARAEHAGRAWATHHCADRHARAQALGQRHHVGLDAGPLVGEPLAGAPDAALHLVEHQQPVMLVAQAAQRLQVGHGGGVDAALALDHLEEDRHHVRPRLGRFLDRRHVVQRHPHEALHQRPEAGLHLGVAGGRQRGDRAAVKGLLVDDDLRAVDALVVTELARDLQRGLVGLQPGAAEKGIGQPAQIAQPGGELLLQRRLVVVRAVDQLADLVGQRRHQPRVGVAQGVDGDPAQRVEVLAAFGVPHAAALAMRQRERQAAVGVHHVGGRRRLRDFGRVHERLP